MKDREYFLRVRENRTWALPPECVVFRKDGSSETSPPGIDRFALESIRSITRMNTQAVLSVPNESPGEDLPVASLAIPMLSLIKPVLPHGFGFAVIEDKDQGRGCSTATRSESNELLSRAASAAPRLVEPLHREFCLPFARFGARRPSRCPPGPGLFEEDLVRSVNVDWMVTTLLFLIPYMLRCVGVCFLILIRPQRRATSLWPHPRGLKAYLQLAVFYAAAIISFDLALSAPGPQLAGGECPTRSSSSSRSPFPLSCGSRRTGA